jgi:hypothetical protein
LDSAAIRAFFRPLVTRAGYPFRWFVLPTNSSLADPSLFQDSAVLVQRQTGKRSQN